MMLEELDASSGRGHRHTQGTKGRSSNSASEALRGTETILLVEDDTAVRTATKRILERYGYRVFEAQGAQGALEIAVVHKGPLALLLTDLVLPGMSGAELARQVRLLRPEIRVVFTSGYDEETLVS